MSFTVACNETYDTWTREGRYCFALKDGFTHHSKFQS